VTPESGSPPGYKAVVRMSDPELDTGPSSRCESGNAPRVGSRSRKAAKKQIISSGGHKRGNFTEVIAGYRLRSVAERESEL